MTTATLTKCRGCNIEIPTEGRTGARRWCAKCGKETAPRTKARIEEAENAEAIAGVVARAREKGTARQAPGPVAVRHDPSIVKATGYPEKHCRSRECGKPFIPHSPRQAFCDECRRDR